MAEEKHKNAQAKWRSRNPEKQKAATLRWRQAHLERVREQDRARRRGLPRDLKLESVRKWKAAHPDRARLFNILGRIKFRAKEKGLTFDPAVVKLVTENIADNCPCCGLPFEEWVYGAPANLNRYKARLRSIDRVENSRGYTLDNVQGDLPAVQRPQEQCPR